jgi:hypothetical protein
VRQQDKETLAEWVMAVPGCREHRLRHVRPHQVHGGDPPQSAKIAVTNPADACDLVGIGFVKMLNLTLTDGPWPKDERVESVSLAFGPPILHELRLILMFIEDTKKEAARKALEAR